MAFYGYNGEVDWTIGVGYESHYSSPCYTGDGEPHPIPFDYYKQDYSLSTYSDYKDDYSLSTHSHPINYASHDYYVNQSESYYTHPKYLQYDPPLPSQGFFPSDSETKFTVSYSTVEFGLPVFEEYDPTPYDGGYDQAMTYGKPVPPSDVTCYPRTLPGPPLENFSFDSISSPYGRDDDDIIPPPNGTKPADAPGDVDDGGKAKDAAAIVEVEPRDVVPFLSYDYPSYQHQNPYGSGLEAMDICESLFGYWPCLAKKAQQQQQQRIYDCPVCHPADRRIDPWKSAADYLFGSPLPYGYDNHHHHHHHSLYQSDQIS